MKAHFRYLFPLLMIATLWPAGVSGQDVYQLDNRFFSTKEISKRVPTKGRKLLVIKSALSLRGQVNIVVSDKPEIILKYKKQAQAATRDIATDFIDLITVETKSKPDRIVVQSRAPNPAPWASEGEAGLVEIDLVVPKGFEVEFEATYFSALVEGPLSRFKTAPSLGEFDLTGITDELLITTKNRRVTLADITGLISVTTSNSLLKASRISGTIGVAEFSNERGEIRLDEVTGEINVRNKFGRISISEFDLIGDGNFIRGESGPIDIELIGARSGQLVISNRYEDISLTIPDTLSTYMSLSVGEEGSIEAVNFPFKTDLVEQDRLNLVSGSGRVEIVGSVRVRGSIYVRGIESEAGDEN